MITRKLRIASDLVGIASSGLCLIHCLATPFIFAAQSAKITSCTDAPMAWSMIDFLFIGISFFAIWWTVKSTSKEWIKYALWISLVLSFGVILNEKLHLLPLPGFTIYITAMMLIVLHLYNHRYCKCKDDGCCVD